MTTLYLVRHGAVTDSSFIYGRTDMQLSDKGVQQLTRMGEHLREKGVIPSSIVSSPLTRTMQSARALGKAFGVQDVKTNDDLLEVDFGPEIVGKPFSFFSEVADDLFTHTVEGKPRSQETPEQLVERMFHALKTIQEGNDGETIFVVGHGDPLSFALWRLIHPDGNLPTVPQMEQEGTYLQKGEAARIVLDDAGRLAEYEMIRLDEERLSGEAEGKRNPERK